MLENNSLVQSLKWQVRKSKLKRELRKAEDEHNKDVERLADLNEDQVRFLATADELPDRLSDNIANEHDTLRGA